MEGKSQQGKQKEMAVWKCNIQLWACVWKENFGLSHVTPGGHRRHPGFEVRAFAGGGGGGLWGQRGSGG